MELSDIKEIVADILASLQNNKVDYTYRTFETFVEGAGNRTPNNLLLLKKFHHQFKKHGLVLSCGREPRTSILHFRKGEVVTFRQAAASEVESAKEKTPSKRLSYQHAGSIKIAGEESGLTLYKHQEEAIEQLQQQIVRPDKCPYAGLLVLPTGGGKTLTAAYWIAKNYLDKGKKVLWIAHRHELLEQAKATFHERLAFKDIFAAKSQFNYRLISGIHDRPVNIRPTDDLIISSKDSLNAGFDYLQRNWLQSHTEEVFLVVDEAHHATAKTYRKLIKSLRTSVDRFQMLGLTATPFRTVEEEQGLLARVFPDNIVYKVDLRTLITRGILSEPIFEEEETGFDMLKELSEEELDRLNYFDIESIGKGTAKTIAENDQRNWAIVNRYAKNKKKYKQTIVFALNQDNAIALKKLFEEAGVKAEYVLSSIRDMATGISRSSKENKDTIDRFRRGELEVLINVNILTEGTDLPGVQSVFLARPTISPILMTQMIGRGLRGEKAGGTKDAYIVSFIDEWRDKVAWVNPEKLLIEENVDFEDKQVDTRKQLVRLVAINKIEEFAILTNKIIDAATKEELERLDFVERLPLGIYHFSLLNRVGTEEREKNCEVLVYDNVRQSYADFVNGLGQFFEANRLTGREYLEEVELTRLSKKVEEEFFFGCPRYPAFYEQDIKDVLQYYAQNEVEPRYVEFKEREKYDLSRVAQKIYEDNMSLRDVEAYKNSLWEGSEVEWKAFFGYDKKYFLNEIDLALRKLSNPELYKKASVVPQDEKELRELERLSLSELREQYPTYWKQLSDAVYAKYTDSDGFYFSASRKHKSKKKLDFQIDHIQAMHHGGLTVLDNLQLLTRSENARKGVREVVD